MHSCKVATEQHSMELKSVPVSLFVWHLAAVCAPPSNAVLRV